MGRLEDGAYSSYYGKTIISIALVTIVALVS